MAREVATQEIMVGGEVVRAGDFYTPAQTSKILGVGLKTIHRRVQDGLLRRSGHARSILYKGEHIIKYLNTSFV